LPQNAGIERDEMTQTTATDDVHAKLVAYLCNAMPEVTDLLVTQLRRLSEGWSRECYSFSLAFERHGARESHDLILRRDPTGSIVYTDRAVESMVLKAVHAAGMCVPTIWFLDAEGGALDTPFMIMERMPGTSSPTVLYADHYAEQREVIGREFIRQLATLHAMDWSIMDLPFSDAPSVDTAAERAVARWEKTLQEQQLQSHPFLAQSLRWLRNNLPVAERISLLHGDYRTGNFLFEEDRITAVVDWELAELGDPLEDLGWVFKELWMLGDKICGFFERDEFIRLYEEFSGIHVDPDALRFWEMYAEFRHGIMAVTGARTIVDKKSDEINFSISHLYLAPLENEQAKVMGI
jgi:aminoglycoside phosphotransferase (APT) family kinase protein